jgi:hypothetical protein
MCHVKSLRVVSTTLAACLALLSAGQSGAQSAESAARSWAGTYTSPFGLRLTLDVESAGRLSGELIIRTRDQESRYPVALNPTGSSRLVGEFSSGGDAFAMEIAAGDEPNQIVMTSEGNVYELTREGGQAGNPLGQFTAPQSGPASTFTSSSTRNYTHPDGYFSLSLPTGWTPMLHAPNLLELDTSLEEGFILVLMAELEPYEIGRPLLQNVPGALVAVNDFLNVIGVSAEASSANTSTTSVGPLTGAISLRSASDGFERMTVWQGTVIEGSDAVMVVAAVPVGQEQSLFPAAESVFGSLRLLALPGGNPALSAGQFSSAAGYRNVVFNGLRLDAQTLARLEGPVPMIPDGNYWYDRASGMVGYIGGPTIAYFAANLDFCPPMSPQASGGLTNVAVNGRYLHPDDIAGLQYYFGAIVPGRYWMDGLGNYGIENGPALGNLIQQIALMQQYAAAALQGAGAQGGGFYDSGTVYSHFPNTGVSIAEFGNNDMIVNADGVMWWPGK